jgi:putative ABC transport system permease protein
MRDVLVQTWSNLRANRLRSLLTMFGIIWGVVSIVVLSAVGEGFQRGNQAVLEELGKNVLIIRNGRTSMQAGGERAGRPVRLRLDDVHALVERSRLLEHVSPELMRGGVSAKSAYNSSLLQMSGIWPVFQTIRTIEVDSGRLINAMDEEQARRVVVIGDDVAQQLFAGREPVGEQLTLNGIPYTVIGKIRKKAQDSNYTGADNERLFVPYATMRRHFPMTGRNDSADMVSAIIASPYQHVSEELRRMVEREGTLGFMGLAASGPVEDEIRSILGPRHGFDTRDPEALMIWNTALTSIMFGKMIGAMAQFFLSVSVITLVLGGIGVMNIMLVAVRERTREIGVRKAVGATAGTVQLQFFSEGLMLTLLSGCIGLAAGYGLCRAVNMVPMPERFAGMVITWETALIAIAALTLVGVAASLYPARRAALLPPIEALRYEM